MLHSGGRGVDWVAPEKVIGRLPLMNAVLKEVMRIRLTSSTGIERVVPEGGRMVAGVFFARGFVGQYADCSDLS